MPSHKTRNALIVVAVGLTVLAGTFLLFNAMYMQIAPTEADFNRAASAAPAQGRLLVNELIARSNQADSMRASFIIVAAIELIAALIALGVVLNR